MWKRAVGSLRRVMKAMWRPRVEYVPRWWLHCPICDRELVGPWHAGAHIPNSPGPEWLDPAREELIAKCPVHGHLPFNDASKAPPWPRVAFEPKRERPVGPADPRANPSAGSGESTGQLS